MLGKLYSEKSNVFSEDVWNKIPSLFCRVMIFEFCNIPVMLFVGTVVHSEETEY
jgi:hypothetical protein